MKRTHISWYLEHWACPVVKYVFVLFATQVSKDKISNQKTENGQFN